MKKIKLSILFLAICAIALNAQINLTYKTHCLLVGTSHDFIFTNDKNEGPAGANVIWDFSDLQPSKKTLTSHMLDPALLDKSSAISKANTAIEEFGNIYYFKVEQGIMEQYGSVCCNTTTIYDKPFLKLKFPMTYGDKAVGNYSGIQESPNLKVAVQGKYEVVCDAYGTLILPGDISVENVLRVKQTRTIDAGSGSKMDEITYRWYSADIRYPILVIVKYITPKESYIAQTAMYAHAGEHHKSATLIDSPEPVSGFNAYPSPYHEKLTISYDLESDGKVQIDLFDMSGRLTRSILNKTKQDKGYHSLTINNDDIDFLPGIYYVRLTLDNRTYMKKVVKQ